MSFIKRLLSSPENSVPDPKRIIDNSSDTQSVFLTSSPIADNSGFTVTSSMIEETIRNQSAMNNSIDQAMATENPLDFISIEVLSF